MQCWCCTDADAQCKRAFYATVWISIKMGFDLIILHSQLRWMCRQSISMKNRSQPPDFDRVQFRYKTVWKFYLTQVRRFVPLVTHACWRHWWRWGGWPTGLASPFIRAFCVAWWRYSAGYVRNTVYHGLQKKEQFNTEQQHTTEGLFTPSAALTFALTLALTLERNTLVSIAPSTPSIYISINTSDKIQFVFGPIQKRQR